ncbi:hypothetical protein BLOT_011816 [Blomia tropicalis]|nr:hypothetical protein BLOT_011816 [Blomia tropicalis]
MYKETTLKELSTSWNIEYEHRISSIRPKFMNWRNEKELDFVYTNNMGGSMYECKGKHWLKSQSIRRKIQSTSVDTFNWGELKAIYEKPYKVLTSLTRTTINKAQRKDMIQEKKLKPKPELKVLKINVQQSSIITDPWN